MSQTNETLDEEKKRIKREKHREYMRKRRSEDPDFNEKQKELNRNRKKYSAVRLPHNIPLSGTATTLLFFFFAHKCDEPPNHNLNIVIYS
jgi:hypothetical protein